jgi:histone acetyltransferase
MWVGRVPELSNLRLHPGLRHRSRLWTAPAPSKSTPGRFSTLQLKYEFNHPHAHPQVLLHLNDAKIVISAQLPEMGARYVARLIFDFHAVTGLLIHNGVVKGALCSRVFPEERFLEIVFLGVETTYQALGFGRLLMNYVKTVTQADEFYDLLACADNGAVGYFQKLGFNSKAINMDPKRWVGRIKDYVGVTLVHCRLYPEVDYMNFQLGVAQQMKFFESQTRRRVHKPLFGPGEVWLPYPQAPSFLSRPLPEVIAMSGCGNLHPDEERLAHDYRERMADLKSRLLRILRQLQADEKFVDIFQRPVTDAIAPGYLLSIKKPIDFQTIERRFARFTDYYKRPEMFWADIQQMVENCKQFNPSDTMYYKAAVSLWGKFRALYAAEFPDGGIDR